MKEIRYTILTTQLCQPVARLLEICFPDMPPEEQYNVTELHEMVEIFPEGTIVALDGDSVIGMGTGIFIDLDFDNFPPTDHDLLYTGKRCNHNPAGAFYYGSDMAVHPNYRGLGIGRAIYNRRKALVVDQNKKGFVAGAVIPGFVNHKDRLSIQCYVNKVVDGELFDPTLSVQLRNGFKFIRLLPNFFIFPRSDNWGALIFWENVDFRCHSSSQ